MIKNLPFISLLCSSALALINATVEAKTLYLYVLTGQSNSLGAVKGSPASPELLKQYQSDGSTLFWHNNFNKNSGQSVDKKPVSSTSWGKIIPQHCGYNLMGPEYGFASMIERKKWKITPEITKNDSIGIVKASLDGGGQEFWDPQQKPLSYNAVINAVKAASQNALNTGFDKVKIVGLIYLQGESNVNDQKVDSNLLKFINNLQKDVAGKSIDVSSLKAGQAILGEHASWNSTNDTNTKTGDITGGENGTMGKAGQTAEKLFKLTQSKQNMGWVPTRDLSKITSGDNMGVHYDGKSQITIGSRYAYEAAKLAGTDVGTTRSGDRTAPLNTPQAWMNGQLPLKTTAIWDVASSAKDTPISAASGKNAAFYGISIEDPFLNTVTLFTTDQAKNSRVILGKGGININNGKNLTINTSVDIATNQVWTIAGGSTLTIESNDQAPITLGGKGLVSIKNSTLKDNPTGVAKIIIQSKPSPAGTTNPSTWKLGKGVELIWNGKTISQDK